MESLLTQTLIIHIIRTRKLPFIQSRASRPLTVMTLLVAATGVCLPISWFAGALGFTPLPPQYWLALVGILIGYAVLAQTVKAWLVRRWDQ